MKLEKNLKFVILAMFGVCGMIFIIPYAIDPISIPSIWLGQVVV